MGMSRLTVFASIVITLIVVTVAALFGHRLGESSVSRELSACRAEQAAYHAEQAEAAEIAAHSLALAFGERQRITDELTRQLGAQRATAARLKQERQSEIERQTDQRGCLRDDVLRLLDGAPGLRVQLPAGRGGAAGAHAAYVATDTDIAGWTLDAGERYAECVRRYDALIEATGGAPRE